VFVNRKRFHPSLSSTICLSTALFLPARSIPVRTGTGGQAGFAEIEIIYERRKWKILRLCAMEP
jgi:hypothetical protein